MSKTQRLQVMFEEPELEALRQTASDDGLTVSEWVRMTLRAEQQRRRSDRTPEKLAVLQRALEFEFPAPDIDQMLDEISRGRDLSDLRDDIS